jgi:hypothetical protein
LEGRAIDKLVVLQTCIKLLRAASAPLPDYNTIFDITRPRKFRKLKDLISFDGHSWEVSRLKEFIKHIFREEGTSAHPPPHEDDVSSLSLYPLSMSAYIPLKPSKSCFLPLGTTSLPSAPLLIPTPRTIPISWGP